MAKRRSAVRHIGRLLSALPTRMTRKAGGIAMRACVRSGVEACLLSAMVLVGVTSAAAQSRSREPQDRQFMFSISTLPTERRHATVHVDSGFGDRAFDATDSDRPEQRIGLQASLTGRLSFVGRIGVA